MAYYGPLSCMRDVIKSPEAVAVVDQFIPGLCGAVTPESSLYPMAIQRILQAFPEDDKKAIYDQFENVKIPE